MFQRPLTRSELGRFDTILFDPPRAGAEAQAKEIAASRRLRHRGLLQRGDFRARRQASSSKPAIGLDSVAPVDQFRFSPHVEIVGAFSRTPAKKRAKGLLG